MCITVRLKLPQYLKEWIIFRMGGSEPVSFPKGSPYNQLLRMFLRPKSEREESWMPRAEDTVDIVVPHFPGKRPETHNYLPQRAKANLADLIRDSFDLQLWSDFAPLKASPARAKDIVMTWMEENGIEMTDRNYESVMKRLKILKRREDYREYKRKSNA